MASIMKLNTENSDVRRNLHSLTVLLLCSKLCSRHTHNQPNSRRGELLQLLY
jgi:hypothetical protein